MRRLNRYLISNTMKLLLVGELAGIVIFTMIDFFEHIDVFTETSGSSSWASPIVALKVPNDFNLHTPPGIPRFHTRPHHHDDHGATR